MKIRRRTQITITTERSFSITYGSGDTDQRLNVVVSHHEPERKTLGLELVSGQKLVGPIIAQDGPATLGKKDNLK